MSALDVYRLGRLPYEPVWRAMRDYTDTRTPEAPDMLWLVEHDPVFTQGQAGLAEHVLMPGDIPVVATDRGGQVTYHGPGQLVLYPLLDVRRHHLGVRDLVTALENAVIDALAEHGVEARARPDAPGVYVGEAKIASLGLRIRRGCSFHGVAFNVDMDLAPFARINPCGYAGLAMTQLRECVAGPVRLDQEASRLIRCLATRLGIESLVEHEGLPAGLAPDAASRVG
ncbi:MULTISPECIES: lipoyl(octanoyl) transferase LipB [Modicisalibacter]|uniref:lipoyl(octanoyl) transferase LipB n=1 Tax=Modicisalibacter TaxID=574347 RepID=UPI00100BDC3D|nr:MULTISPECIES: lipoyl(octanoyl) transferase LipB [Halomonadaceae]MBZ9560345.1 lipoyl(octanoyl) transferase LipB [Modicisalibacter sp. R2A 31.J]MBZ9576254.1 lipoyl(octanoyl) transferase LipB [Modicisalibacter sp. MOD 31.J]